jgi:hypothetical protein
LSQAGFVQPQRRQSPQLEPRRDPVFLDVV